jgi:hypothetical protein
MTAMRSIDSRGDNRLCAANMATYKTTAMGRMGLWCVISLALIWSIFLLTARPVAAQSYQIYVPLVTTEGSGPKSSGGEATQCGLNEQELAIAQLMLTDPGQQRSNPICDPILAQVARARARDMALRGYFSHTNPDGEGPNLLAREAGYALPEWYGSNQDANNIESIGGGYSSPEAAWQGWLGSPTHRTHVLATQEFYAQQEAYGVGYYYDPNSPFGYYWVFISAPLAGTE